MKKCPFCAEEIQDDAIKCKHCGEFLDGRAKVAVAAPVEKLPWHFRSSIIVLLILTVGPFALPLVWFHPKYSLNKKIVITVVVLIVTYFLAQGTAAALKTINEYYQTMTNAV